MRKPSLVILLVDDDDPERERLHHALEDAGHQVKLFRFGLNDAQTDIEVTPDRVMLVQDRICIGDADFAEATSVFYRRWKMCPEPMVRSSLAVHDDARFAEREWDAAVFGALLDIETRYPNLIWLNRPCLDLISRHKLHLLNNASGAGFVVPQWCLATKMRFLPNDTVIAKAINVDEYIDKDRHLATTTVDEETLNDLMKNRLSCPSLLQRYVTANEELRVYYVRGAMTCLRLQKKEQTSDSRFSDITDLKLDLVPCAPALLTAAHRFCKKSGFEFVVFDVLVPSSGELCLVDITPNGTWVEYEKLSGVPLTANIAFQLGASA